MRFLINGRAPARRGGRPLRRADVCVWEVMTWPGRGMEGGRDRVCGGCWLSNDGGHLVIGCAA